MNNKIRQLTTIVKLEKDKEMKALKVYVEANNYVKGLEQQLQELIAYREEYRQKLAVKPDTKKSIYIYQLSVQFIDQLERAIKEQQEKIPPAKNATAERFNQYLSAKNKAEGLQKMLDKAISDEQQKQVKQEQKQYDELASNQWYSIRKESE